MAAVRCTVAAGLLLLLLATIGDATSPPLVEAELGMLIYRAEDLHDSVLKWPLGGIASVGPECSSRPKELRGIVHLRVA
ncbi:dicarboxylate carrier [Anopheles sinensis]|uniref:Dicarboxylate carrier n=1 Tax=Anopheles sinensis TaxID=74873 RepID=A0A084VTN8_ANOSI|nr:dicarboxylate carrier [Anopheles sinensis]